MPELLAKKQSSARVRSRLKPTAEKNGKGSVLSVRGRIPSDGMRLTPGLRGDEGIRAQLELRLENGGLSILESIIVDHWAIDKLLIGSGF